MTRNFDHICQDSRDSSQVTKGLFHIDGFTAKRERILIVSEHNLEIPNLFGEMSQSNAVLLMMGRDLCLGRVNVDAVRLVFDEASDRRSIMQKPVAIGIWLI
jgi:hypothetical protein